MNETSATAAPWPPFKERYERLIEAIELCRALWSGERVSFEGSYYQTDRATIYERSEHPVPIYVAASGPRSARMAGRIADGFICTSGKKPELYEELLAAVADGAHKADRNPDEIDRMIEIKVSYHPDIEVARKACNWWGALALTTEEKSGIDDPVELERLADAIADRAQTRFIVSDNADEVIERVRPYVELGFRHLVFHAPEADQPEFLRRFSEEVLPRMRERWPAIQPDLDDRAATLP